MGCASWWQSEEDRPAVKGSLHDRANLARVVSYTDTDSLTSLSEMLEDGNIASDIPPNASLSLPPPTSLSLLPLIGTQA